MNGVEKKKGGHNFFSNVYLQAITLIFKNLPIFLCQFLPYFGSIMPTVAFGLFSVFVARTRKQFLISGFIKEGLLAFFNSNSGNKYWAMLYKRRI
jgi:hypothetical protein